MQVQMKPVFQEMDLRMVYNQIKTAPVLAYRDGGGSPKRYPIFTKDIVSSSERLHNQNVCVVVIFVPTFKEDDKLWLKE
nr:MAG TPA: hypothetical protein [Caudoviricetes sp.]